MKTGLPAITGPLSLIEAVLAVVAILVFGGAMKLAALFQPRRAGG